MDCFLRFLRENKGTESPRLGGSLHDLTAYPSGT